MYKLAHVFGLSYEISVKITNEHKFESEWFISVLIFPHFAEMRSSTKVYNYWVVVTANIKK